MNSESARIVEVMEDDLPKRQTRGGWPVNLLSQARDIALAS